MASKSFAPVTLNPTDVEDIALAVERIEKAVLSLLATMGNHEFGSCTMQDFVALAGGAETIRLMVVGNDEDDDEPEKAPVPS